jgi:hypothetical protein
MNFVSEAIKARQSYDPRHTLGSTPTIPVNPNSVNITKNIEKIFNDRAQKFRRNPPNDSVIRGQLAKLISDRLKWYYENIDQHPDMGLPKDWVVEQAKVDYINNHYVFVCIVKNKAEDARWLVFFDANNNLTKNIDPRYVNVETSFLDLDEFPMSVVSDSPQEAVGKAIELSKKKLEDSIKDAKEVEDIF